jgi:hypothetical protein
VANQHTEIPGRQQCSRRRTGMAKARSCLCTTAAHACQGQAVHRRGEEGARSSHRTSSLQGASRSIEAAGFVTWPCMARLKSGRLGAHVARHPINFGILWNPRPPRQQCGGRRRAHAIRNGHGRRRRGRGRSCQTRATSRDRLFWPGRSRSWRRGGLDPANTPGRRH